MESDTFIINLTIVHSDLIAGSKQHLFDNLLILSSMQMCMLIGLSLHAILHSTDDK